MAKFENTLAVAAKHDRSQWELGDALIKDIPPSSDYHNGSTAKLTELSELLAEQGYDYELGYLRILWWVANKFPSNTRVSHCASWAVHRLAQSPDMLDVILKSARLRDGQRLTLRRAKAILAAIEDREHEQARREHVASGKKSAPPKRPTKTSPPQNTAPVTKSAIDVTASLHEIMGLIARSDSACDRAAELLEKNLLAFVPEAYDAMVEGALAVANKWQKFSQAAARTRKRGGHLSVVNE
jgi:hypothetical protein